jgi:hypothetical protein
MREQALSARKEQGMDQESRGSELPSVRPVEGVDPEDIDTPSRIDVEVTLGSLERLYTEFLSDHPRWQEAKALINEIGSEIWEMSGQADAWRDK